jgi:Domain of unknown function (DUF4157)
MTRQRLPRPVTTAHSPGGGLAARTVLPARGAIVRQHAGNQSLQALLRAERLQAKLEVSQPGDVFEQEADRVADEVMRPAAAEAARTSSAPPSPPPIQRLCSECKEEEAGTLARQQDEPRPQDEEGALEAKELPGKQPQVSPPLEARIASLRTGGEPLAARERGFFEPRFGSDFSGVRVHADSQAGEVARAVEARAFTTGRHVFFGSGQYAPGDEAGRRLLAHELTHVVQQGGGERLHRQPGPEPGPEAAARAAGPTASDPQTPAPQAGGFLPGLPGQSTRISARVGALFQGATEPQEKVVSRSPVQRLFRVPSGPATGTCSWNCPPGAATTYAPTSDSIFNCYGYAMGFHDRYYQPGQIAGTTEYQAAVLGDPAAVAAVGGTAGILAYYTPAGVLRNATADLGAPLARNCLGCCSRTKRKIVAVTTDSAAGVGFDGPYTASGDGWDHHWYRKDADHGWSHKRDGLASEREDSGGAGPICSPCRVRRSYPGLNYNHVVGAWCV